MKTAPRFDVTDWYWRVGDKSPGTQVYSSAANSYVPVNNPAYVAWLLTGKTTNIETEQLLADTLTLAGLPLPPTSSASSATKGGLFDSIPRAIQVWAFAAENRLRALEGQPARTAAQFKAYVLGLPGW